MLRKGVFLSSEKINKVLKLFKRFIKSETTEVIYDCLRGLCGISCKSESNIQLIIENNLLSTVLLLISHNSEEICLSAIRTAGNVLSGSSAQAQILINLGVIEKFSEKIYSSSPAVRKEVFWALSNICAGTHSQIAHFVDHPLIITSFTGLFDFHSSVREEAS